LRKDARNLRIFIHYWRIFIIFADEKDNGDGTGTFVYTVAPAN
jgi:hypothetical protein